MAMVSYRVHNQGRYGGHRMKDLEKGSARIICGEQEALQDWKLLAWSLVANNRCRMRTLHHTENDVVVLDRKFSWQAGATAGNADRSKEVS